MSYKPNPRWAEYKDSEWAFQPRYPVKPCPYCNHEPVFVKLIEDGKWGKIKWHAIDHCGTLGGDATSRNISDCIAIWQSEARHADKAMQPSSGYWKAVKLRKKAEQWDAKYGHLSWFFRWWNNVPPRPEI